MSELDSITIYTDGGADPNPGPGGWGAVLIHDDSGAVRDLSGYADNTTNNRMELTAAIEALRALKRPCDVLLYTDSTYLRNGITKWVEGWRAKGWQKKDGSPVENADLWRDLLAVLAQHEVAWQWVKGHDGNQYNERADQLATAAMRRNRAPVEARDSGYRAYILISAQGTRGYWAVMLQHGDAEETFFGTEQGLTSSQLDIFAASHALHLMPDGVQAQVFTLSDYLRNGASQWIKGWKKRNWTKKDGNPVANQALWMRLDEEMAHRRVDWPVVKRDDAPGEFETLGVLAQEYFAEQEAQRQGGDVEFDDLPPEE